MVNFPAELRRLADAIEAMQPKLDDKNDKYDTCGNDAVDTCCRLKIDVVFYGVQSLNNLRAIRGLMQGEPKADQSRGNHWIKGEFCDRIEICAHYSAGLLGKTKPKRTVVVDQESTNVAILG